MDRTITSGSTRPVGRMICSTINDDFCIHKTQASRKQNHLIKTLRTRETSRTVVSRSGDGSHAQSTSLFATDRQRHSADMGNRHMRFIDDKQKFRKIRKERVRRRSRRASERREYFDAVAIPEILDHFEIVFCPTIKRSASRSFRFFQTNRAAVSTPRESP